MKNLNRKGLTLTELIVSFAIVAVAVVYFYQTLYTVRKLYTTAQTETQEYVDKNYAIRVVDSYIDKYGTTDLDGGNTSKTKICEAFSLKYLNKDNCSSVKAENVTGVANLKKITITWDGKVISFNRALTKPVVKKYVLPLLAAGSSRGTKFFNESPINKNDVETIKFVSTIDKPDGYEDGNSWDASYDGESGGVIAWYKDEDSNGKYELIIGGDGNIIFPKNSSNLFNSFNNLKEINFNNAIDTSEVSDMAYMFKSCEKLTKLNLSNFDTSSVENMAGMFYHCEALTELDLSNFDTLKVKKMYNMFAGCYELTKLNLSNFNTSSVENMSGMFYHCEALTELDLSMFDTLRVENMASMFESCLKLTKLDLSNFNTSNVANMASMFYNCQALTNLDLSGFNTSKVTNMASMFYNCKALTNLDLSGFNTSNVTEMNHYISYSKRTLGMFEGCENLQTLKLGPSFTTPQIDNMSRMFYNCKALTNLDLSSFTSAVPTVSMQEMFGYCSALETLNLSSFDATASSLERAFEGCKALKDLYLNKLKIKKTRPFTSGSYATNGINEDVKIYIGSSDIKNTIWTSSVQSKNFIILK